MADILNFSVTPQGAKFKITAKIVDSQTQQTVQRGKKANGSLDFTGAQSLIFPDDLAKLPAAKQLSLVTRWMGELFQELSEEL